LSFLLIVWYTRFLSPSDYGVISLAEIVGAVVAALCALGLNGGMQRLYFHYVDQPQALRRYVSSVLRFASISTLSVTALVLLLGARFFAWLTPGLQVRFFPYIALAIGTASAGQLFDYRLGIYQVQERPRPYAMLTGIAFLLTASAVIILVIIVRWGALGMLLGKLVGAIVMLVASAYLSKDWLGGGWAWSFVRETLPISLPLLPHTLLALGLVVADRFILQHYRSLDEVGIYSLAYTFGMAMYIVAASLGQAWGPIFYDLARNGVRDQDKILRALAAVVMLLTAVGIFGSLIAQSFTHWFLDSRYNAVGRLVPWIIGGYLFHALFSIFQLSALQARRTTFIWVISLGAFSANIVLNLAWVPSYGMYGAAYATLAAYLVEAVLMYAYAQKVYGLPFLVEVVLGPILFLVGLGVSQVRWPDNIRPVVILAVLLGYGVVFWFRGGRSASRQVWRLLKSVAG